MFRSHTGGGGGGSPPWVAAGIPPSGDARTTMNPFRCGQGQLGITFHEEASELPCSTSFVSIVLGGRFMPGLDHIFSDAGTHMLSPGPSNLQLPLL